jgi:hypothetical protein
MVVLLQLPPLLDDPAGAKHCKADAKNSDKVLSIHAKDDLPASEVLEKLKNHLPGSKHSVED